MTTKMKNKRVIVGQRLSYNAGSQIRYYQNINQLVLIMVNETKQAILRLFGMGEAKKFYHRINEASAVAMDASLSEQATVLTNKLLEKFSLMFAKSAPHISKNMVKGQEKISSAALPAATVDLLGSLALKGNLVSQEQADIAQALITENVSLMTSLPQQYMKDITGEVMRSITTGRGLQDLIPALEKYEGITKRRAKDIAYDQTRKAYTAINKQKMLDIGLKKFKWLHSRGSQFPRHSHLDILNGKIFSFENLIEEQAALGVPERDRGLPGYPINCGCTMMTVLEWDEE